MDKLKHFEPLFIFLTLLATVVGWVFIIYQIQDARKSTDELLSVSNDNTVTQLVYSLEQELLTPPNEQILYAIEQGTPIRSHFSNEQIDNYLSIYEALGVLYAQNEKTSFYNNGTPTQVICDTFFDPIIETMDNSEIQSFLKERRKDFPAYQSYLNTLKRATDHTHYPYMCPDFN